MKTTNLSQSKQRIASLCDTTHSLHYKTCKVTFPYDCSTPWTIVEVREKGRKMWEIRRDHEDTQTSVTDGEMVCTLWSCSHHNNLRIYCSSSPQTLFLTMMRLVQSDASLSTLKSLLRFRLRTHSHHCRRCTRKSPPHGVPGRGRPWWLMWVGW